MGGVFPCLFCFLFFSAHLAAGRCDGQTQWCWRVLSNVAGGISVAWISSVQSRCVRFLVTEYPSLHESWALSMPFSSYLWWTDKCQLPLSFRQLSASPCFPGSRTSARQTSVGTAMGRGAFARLYLRGSPRGQEGNPTARQCLLRRRPGKTPDRRLAELPCAAGGGCPKPENLLCRRVDAEVCSAQAVLTLLFVRPSARGVKISVHPPSDTKNTLSMLGCVCVYVCLPNLGVSPPPFFFSECDHVLDDTWAGLPFFIYYHYILYYIIYFCFLITLEES